MTKKLSSGRLSRAASTARVGLRSGLGLLTSRDGEAAAVQAAEVLGELRGLASKVGQMASYVDGFVPESQRAAYERALGALQTATPSSPPDAVRAIIEQELGAPVEALFAELEPEPFASASIGQVHRGRLVDGTAVAVKVQHPGIDRAVESDLSNARMLPALIGRVAGAGAEIGAVFEEVAQRFRDELDYTKEAAQQRWFAELHADDPSIRIPRVFADRSSRRVLTSELCEGLDLGAAGQQPEPVRRRYCETLWRFVYRGNLVGGRFNADPHPGNYLFRPDGTVVFLDFGCVQPLAPQIVQAARAMHLAAARGDEAEFRRNAVAMLGTEGGRYEQFMLEHTQLSFAPLFRSPFRMSRAYVTSIVEGVPEVKKQIFARDRSFRMLHPTLALLMRLQFGFYSVLARLDAEVDYAAVERGFLGEAAAPG